MALALQVEAAAAELVRKPREQINRETALLWTARAMAAYAQYYQNRDVHWLLDAEDYAHEALEHAALSAEGALLHEIRVAISSVQRKVAG